MKLLFVAAEMAPLAKAGGLGDAVAGMIRELAARGHSLRVLLPAYDPALLQAARPLGTCTDGAELLELHDERLPCPVWLLATAGFLQRGSHYYVQADGQPWADDALAFGALGRAACEIAAGMVPDWSPQLVHCHDWHAGLAPVWLQLSGLRVASVFTIHNLQFTGRFAPTVLEALDLPGWLNQPEALEFYGDVAFIKGGLAFADALTTVSPRYAQEIMTPALGCGLEGLLQARRQVLTGILNGIDTRSWNPATDPLLEHHFDGAQMAGKSIQRDALLARLRLPPVREVRQPVLAWIGRLTDQKGADLLLEVLPALLDRPLRIVVLGNGDSRVQSALRALAEQHPQRLAVHLGFDEVLAHRLYAAADLLLMPSRFEPCGLSQLYAMRYGAIPIVTTVGGLADTVRDIDDGGTGFRLSTPSGHALLAAIERALAVFDDGPRWQRLRQRAMARCPDWRLGMDAYERVYVHALQACTSRLGGRMALDAW